MVVGVVLKHQGPQKMANLEDLVVVEFEVGVLVVEHLVKDFLVASTLVMGLPITLAVVVAAPVPLDKMVQLLVKETVETDFNLQ